MVAYLVLSSGFVVIVGLVCYLMGNKIGGLSSKISDLEVLVNNHLDTMAKAVTTLEENVGSINEEMVTVRDHIRDQIEGLCRNVNDSLQHTQQDIKRNVNDSLQRIQQDIHQKVSDLLDKHRRSSGETTE